MVSDQLKNIATKRYRISIFEKVANTVTAFSLTERVVFFVIALVFAGSSFVLLSNLSHALTVPVPAPGGTLSEGIVGIPRFINPLLAISDADRDLTTLVYSGLLKVSSDGTLVPDLAESYDISDDGLTYTFHLRKNAVFHDQTPVTSDDIIFTIKKAQDPNLKSPKRAGWEGVVASKIDEHTLTLSLAQAYPPFLENTTLGILPSHIWQQVETEQFTFSQYNIEPVGSGPYRVKNIQRSSGGIPSSYTLIPFQDYTLEEPYIRKIIFTFYQNEDAAIEALQKKEIHSLSSVSPYQARALSSLGIKVERVALPRIFAVFFNQNDVAAFTHSEVRVALDEALDRERIVEEVLSGYGVPIFGPLPHSLFGETLPHENATSSDARIRAARDILERNGWKPNEEDGVMEQTIKKQKVRLEFSIATSNTEELKAAAQIIKENWEAIGAKVTLAFFDTGDLSQNIIRPRDFDTLFFGEIVGRDLDLFAFWHSSQRNDPGLNVALYANITTDKLLEKARLSSSRSERMDIYREFAKELDKDVPAAFIYSPDFIYVVPPEIKGVNLSAVAIPSDRFLNINEWYIETDRIWHLFSENNSL